MTKVINLYKEPYDVYIGRRGRPTETGHFEGYFGNPHTIPQFASDEQRDECLEKYKIYFFAKLKNDSNFAQAIQDLKGKTLGCFCKPKACHGDVIVEYLDALQ